MSQGQKVNFGSTVTLNQLRKMIPVYAPRRSIPLPGASPWRG